MSGLDDLRYAAAELAARAGITHNNPAGPGGYEPVDSLVDIQRQLLGVDWLRAVYPTLEPNGILDAATTAALSEFQRYAGLAVTGVADWATEQALTAIGAPHTDHVHVAAAPADSRLPHIRPERLTGLWKTLAALAGGLLTVLTLLTGFGVLSTEVRDWIGVAIAGLTPIAVYLTPERGNKKE